MSLNTKTHTVNTMVEFKTLTDTYAIDAIVVYKGRVMDANPDTREMDAIVVYKGRVMDANRSRLPLLNPIGTH
jgi:hypothetical protein